MRNVKQIYKHNTPHWVGDGFLVHPLFSHMGENRGTDPFLMLDYAAPQHYTPNADTPRGVGEHPHKGFETVTLCYHGEVEHKDSSGGGGVIHAGDVQWMTAGSGVVHQEFHSTEFSKKGGLFEMVQLWVNLPAKDKNTPPKYQHLASENIPVVKKDGTTVRVIAGDYNGVKGIASTFSEINVWDATIDADEQIQFNFPESHNVLFVVLRGNIQINSNETAQESDLVKFENTSGDIQVKALDNQAKILILTGEPLNEPVAGYGPFVMNTPEQIREAFQEFRSGKFGSIVQEN